MKETPLPFTVRASSTVGRPRVAAACRKASARASRLWPSTESTCQPKARNLSARGATFITSQVGPSNWTPLSSTMAQTVSRAKWAAVMAASHTWPSWSSPSPSRQ